MDEKEDGPIKNLMTFMRKENYNAPKNWKGFRTLVDK